MAMAALSPNSVLATPIQINPQVRSRPSDITPQLTQDALNTAKTAQTDTITISAQALKMAGSKNMAAKEAANKADEQEAKQLASDKADSEQSEAQKNAVKAYAAMAN